MDVLIKKLQHDGVLRSGDPPKHTVILNDKPSPADAVHAAKGLFGYRWRANDWIRRSGPEEYNLCYDSTFAAIRCLGTEKVSVYKTTEKYEFVVTWQIEQETVPFSSYGTRRPLRMSASFC